MKKQIYIFSPSGAVRDKAAFKRGVARLKALGHEVEVDAAALVSHQRFAGDDETRLGAIHRAAASGADIAMISRGGYGLSRILDKIRYKAVAKAVDKGTHFVGLSDFTAFQCALLAKTGAVSWAGPSLLEGFGVQGLPDDIMEACFDDLIVGQGEGAGWRQTRDKPLGAMDTGANISLQARDKQAFHIKDAMLWGGNLAVLSSLVGTPFFPQIHKGILFLEDIAEHPYRIERMLTQLLHAGVLARQKAIIFGQFTDYKLVAHDKGFNFQAVINWLRHQIKVPVLTNLPFGHVQTKVVLPVGLKSDLLVDGRDAMLIWGQVHEGE
jgi:muramoyltetrapeptide carboxypeptidase